MADAKKEDEFLDDVEMAEAEEFAEDAMEYDDEALELDALKAERDEV